MPASGSVINYVLRPAKHIERKMLCDAFRRLVQWAPLEQYRYLGFGSWYFADFSLFHKTLGIRKMLSIEHQEHEARVRFNRPFRTVSLKFGEAAAILPEISWRDRSIVWLDYDKKLSDTVLNDIDVCCSKLRSGSIILVTLNVNVALNEASPMKSLQGFVNPIKIPSGATDESLRGWGLARCSHAIINDQIKFAMRKRNLLVPAGDQTVYRQLFHFRYADGARMLTVGGVICHEPDLSKFRRCEFERLDFVRDGEEPSLIEVPRLTYREIKHLDSQLPLATNSRLQAKGIDESDLSRYCDLYRYFPNFADADV